VCAAQYSPTPPLPIGEHRNPPQLHVREIRERYTRASETESAGTEAWLQNTYDRAYAQCRTVKVDVTRRARRTFTRTLEMSCGHGRGRVGTTERTRSRVTSPIECFTSKINPPPPKKTQTRRTLVFRAFWSLNTDAPLPSPTPTIPMKNRISHPSEWTRSRRSRNSGILLRTQFEFGDVLWTARGPLCSCLFPKGTHLFPGQFIWFECSSRRVDFFFFNNHHDFEATLCCRHNIYERWRIFIGFILSRQGVQNFYSKIIWRTIGVYLYMISIWFRAANLDIYLSTFKWYFFFLVRGSWGAGTPQYATVYNRL